MDLVNDDHQAKPCNDRKTIFTLPIKISFALWAEPRNRSDREWNGMMESKE